MSPTGPTQLERYLVWLLAHVGWEYDASGPWRCTGERHSFDCSGFQGAGLVAVGARPAGYCTNTNGMAAEIRAARTQVTRDEARVTPGIWAIKEGVGPNGHIVCSLGLINGVARTVEAAGHASGVVQGYFDGPRGFTIYGRPPGLAGFGHDSPVTLKPGVNVGWKLRHHPRHTKNTPGYWFVDDDGHVYSYGLAKFHGGQGALMKDGVPVPEGTVGGHRVALNGKCDDFDPTPSGDGYAMASSVASLYAFGDAQGVGDPHGDPHT